MNKKNIFSKIIACLLAVVLTFSVSAQEVHAYNFMTTLTINATLWIPRFETEVLENIPYATMTITATSAKTGAVLASQQINLLDYMLYPGIQNISLGIVNMPDYASDTIIYTVTELKIAGPDGLYTSDNMPLDTTPSLGASTDCYFTATQTGPTTRFGTTCADITIYPRYEISFMGLNDNLLAYAMYAENADITEPEAPEVEGYKFVGWSPAFNAKAMRSVAYVAQYALLDDDEGNTTPEPEKTTTPGEYKDNNDYASNPAQTEVTLSKPVTYTVSLPLSLSLEEEEIKAATTIDAYDKSGSKQSILLSDITGKAAGSKIYGKKLDVKAKGTITSSSILTITPSVFTLSSSGNNISGNTKADITNLTASSVTFKNALNASLLSAYDLPEDYTEEKTATGYIWIDEDDIKASGTYTGTINFTISLE